MTRGGYDSTTARKRSHASFARVGLVWQSKGVSFAGKYNAHVNVMNIRIKVVISHVDDDKFSVY
jgi:hypothetical protein